MADDSQPPSTLGQQTTITNGQETRFLPSDPDVRARFSAIAALAGYATEGRIEEHRALDAIGRHLGWIAEHVGGGH